MKNYSLNYKIRLLVAYQLLKLIVIITPVIVAISIFIDFPGIEDFYLVLIAFLVFSFSSFFMFLLEDKACQIVKVLDSEK